MDVFSHMSSGRVSNCDSVGDDNRVPVTPALHPNWLANDALVVLGPTPVPPEKPKL